MRIVVDLQAGQATNRHRGIGRYGIWLTQALLRMRGSHEIIVALNDLLPDSIEAVRAQLDGLIDQSCIRVWRSTGPVAHLSADSDSRRSVAELMREAFLAELNPDFILVTSLFEGLVDDAVTSVGKLHRDVPTATVLYDLIPLIYRTVYLRDPRQEAWYEDKLDSLRRSDLLLAISESSRNEGLTYLGFEPENCVAISTATDPRFRPIEVSAQQLSDLRLKTGLERSFVMYTGGIDHRKNVEGLIKAYALLSPSLRSTYQLAIVCSIQPNDRVRLMELAASSGLSDGELILTGFVSDDDLLSLYNLCELFVFPSWHEGFGLPALEAMACGRAVIGANTSSIPEVIGRADALFEPHNDASIAAAMTRVLCDPVLQRSLQAHGLVQSARFKWDDVAVRTLSAMADWLDARAGQSIRSPSRRPSLAYVSPLPPERSGISDYSAELLPELARHYEIDVIVDQESISNAWIRANCKVRSIAWFLKNHRRYERVLYHFGNSSFHQHMFGLLEQVPGVVVLHDFFLSGIVAHMDVTGYDPGIWAQSLLSSHGYAAVSARFKAADTADVVWGYPANVDVIRMSRGVIVHGDSSKALARQWYGSEAADGWHVIPHLRVPSIDRDKQAARDRLKIPHDAFVVATFGMVGRMKQSVRLAEAWTRSSLSSDRNAVLVFVGENDPGPDGRELLASMGSCARPDSMRVTGWADPGVFQDHLRAADLAVQLRTLSRGETSGTVLDCMNYGVATIVNANGSMADLPSSAVWKMPDDFETEELVAALETLRSDAELRARLGHRAREVVETLHDPRICADRYLHAIEQTYRRSLRQGDGLSRSIARADASSSLASRQRLARQIAFNQPARPRARQLLVDVSELALRDAKTGIQRVVRSILRQWLMHPPAGFQIEPVLANDSEPGYRYARAFTLSFLDCPQFGMQDSPVEFGPGDIFLGLDLQPSVQIAQRPWLEGFRRAGGRALFVVYDLLCVQMPEMFLPGAAPGFQRWLEVVACSDGAVCISRAVADDLVEWLQVFGPKREQPFAVDWFHLGSDVSASLPSAGLPEGAQTILTRVEAGPSFLMVGTIEPRKGHAQAIAAFDELWAAGTEANLIIVGKQGWMVEDLLDRIVNHPQFQKRLIWLNGISDQFLELVYARSECVLAASRGEGFGLPLIEGARHGLHLLARSIPSFREVAGEHATYFTGERPGDLARAVLDWLESKRAGKLPLRSAVAPLSWAESAKLLLDRVTRGAG